MKNRTLRVVIPFLVSLLFSYTLYIFILQPLAIFSWSRVMLALLLWAGLFSLIYNWLNRVRIVNLFLKGLIAGTAGIFILINLVLAGGLFNIPYTNFLLPSQIVKIVPISQDKKIKLLSYNTEFIKGVSIENFTSHIGWSTEGTGINYQLGSRNELIWHGKPGQYVEIQFANCGDCGQVKIFWSPLESQQVDLSMESDEKNISVTHEYSPLIWQKFVNFVALELTIFLISFMISMLGTKLFKDTHFDSHQEIEEEGRFGKWIPYISLGVLTVLTYGLKIQPILFNDDWCQVRMLNLNIFMENERRPLHWLLQWTLRQMFPLQTTIYAVYLTNIVLLFITAVLIFVLVRRFNQHQVWFAFLFAGLFLVFPSDYTRLYFTVLGIRLSLLLLIIIMVLFFDFVMNGNWIKGIWIIPLLVLSLLMYEGQIGFAMAWGFMMLVLFYRHLSFRKVSMIAGYLITIGIFVIWKLVIQPRIYSDGKLESLSRDPKEILNRYFSAVPTLLGGFKFPYQDTGWLSVVNIAIIISILICLVAVYYFMSRQYKTQAFQSDLSVSVKADACGLIIGFTLWVAGYFPIILNYPPNIYGHLSRINIFSQPGAVLILLSVTHLILSSLTHNSRVATKLTIMTCFALIFVGSTIQVQSQEAYNRSWREVKDFYGVLLAKIPNVLNDTQLVFLINGYQDDGRIYRPLFSSKWEAQCALTLLYNQPGLKVGYRYEHITVPHFPGYNIFTSTLDTNTISKKLDPAKLLVVRYDAQARSITIQENLSGFQGIDAR